KMALSKRKIATLTVAVVAMAIVVGAMVVNMSGYFGGDECNEKAPEDNSESVFDIVKLPEPEMTGSISLEEAIQNRRSIRNYRDKSLTLEDVSQLLWAVQGISDPDTGKRTVPSAGATYPLGIYLVAGANGVIGLPEGVYRYDPFEHELINILNGDVRDNLKKAALNQGCIKEAPIDIIIAAEFERTTKRYGDRGIHYVYMEAGHAGQNVYLQAFARGLGTVVIGAFNDDEVQQLLHMPSDHMPLYIMPVGYPKM
ncbi:MAG: SagB/ThcOx family dehydrogenase, partial [Candidatus Methanofastidiosia archaeon]